MAGNDARSIRASVIKTELEKVDHSQGPKITGAPNLGRSRNPDQGAIEQHSAGAPFRERGSKRCFYGKGPKAQLVVFAGSST
jgi:hypothetical protein